MTPAPGPRPRRLWVRRVEASWRDVGRDLGRLLRLFSYTRPYRGLLLVSWLATVGYAVAGAWLAHMVEPIFDKVLIEQVQVGKVAVTILVLYAVKGLCAFLSTTMVAAAGQRAVTDLRSQLYDHVLDQSFAFLSR